MFICRPFWINYKYLKKQLNKIATEDIANDGGIDNIPSERSFFKELKVELFESSKFFESLQNDCRVRQERVVIGYNKLKNDGYKYDRQTWARLLRSCVNLYKDVLQLEKFAVTNYCGYSKILKKHDKVTGFATRDAFMRNVMAVQNFTQYPYLLDIIKKSEELYANITNMDR